MMPQGSFTLCSQSFLTWNWKRCKDQSLDEVIDPEREQRSAKDGPYAIWVEDIVEPREDMANISARMHAEHGTKTETLTERCLHEWKYFLETGKHLDIRNLTLCAGSRYRDGSVPDAHWGGGRFGVNWDGVDDRDPHLRARAVVTL